MLVQPHQLILEWIPDLATSLVYACIGQDAIYIVDGLRHTKLAELHTEEIMSAMEIIPRDHLGITDDQNHIVLAGQAPEDVSNDTQHAFLSAVPSNEVMRWEALSWSSKGQQLILAGGDTRLLIAFDSTKVVFAPTMDKHCDSHEPNVPCFFFLSQHSCWLPALVAQRHCNMNTCNRITSLTGSA